MAASHDRQTIEGMISKAFAGIRITDIHTHLYAPEFGSLMLWGIDEVLTYHYLVAETMRWVDMPYADFWAMSKTQQADLIWKTLFIEHSPVSESCRGALTVLKGLGLDVSTRDLPSYRKFFAGRTPESHVDTVFDTAGIEAVVMTNDPFDDAEREFWLSGQKYDQRFRTALRIDPLLNLWETTCPKLKELGYDVYDNLDKGTLAEVRRFLTDWVKRMDALYMAVSLPVEFVYPEDSARCRLIDECVIPVCAELGIPFALMIGVKRKVNAPLGPAGDAVGYGSVGSVERLCAKYPESKFMVTMLARENQHELCVASRKFRNLLIFGCWWFLNNPSLIDEITRMRLELLGLSMIPQHSDARVLDQLIYKWEHSRQVIGEALVDKYTDLAATGWVPTQDEINRDMQGLFGGNFWEFTGRRM